MWFPNQTPQPHSSALQSSLGAPCFHTSESQLSSNKKEICRGWNESKMLQDTRKAIPRISLHTVTHRPRPSAVQTPDLNKHVAKACNDNCHYNKLYCAFSKHSNKKKRWAASKQNSTTLGRFFSSLLLCDSLIPHLGLKFRLPAEEWEFSPSHPQHTHIMKLCNVSPPHPSVSPQISPSLSPLSLSLFLSITLSISPSPLHTSSSLFLCSLHPSLSFPILPSLSPSFPAFSLCSCHPSPRLSSLSP